MPSPQLHVETIAFQGNDPNALPLLVTQTPVARPEWTRTGARHPAAFVASSAVGHITIGATFSSPELAHQTATISASRLDGAGHVLQDVDPAEVTFDGNGDSGDVQFRVALSRHEIDLDSVRWQWHFQVDGGPVHDANISEHEVATVLDVPRAPWTTETPAPAERAHPWWEVLQHACEAAHGATRPEVAAERVTRTVFEDWGEHYYKWHPSAETFASDSGDTPLAFDCERFLSLLDSQDRHDPTDEEDAREIVDCSDIAAILSTFAAILGCPVEQLTLFTDLRCNIVKKVGHDGWDRGVVFGLHEVAVSVPLPSDSDSDSEARVWDGCLMLSGDTPVGTSVPVTPLLPAGLAGSEYLTRLLSSSGTTFDGHVVDDLSGPRTRPIRALSDRLKPLEPTPAPSVVPGVSAPAVRIPMFDPKALERDGWSVVVEPGFAAPRMVDAETDVVARIACGQKSDARTRVRATVYLSPDAEAARRRFDHLVRKIGPSLKPLDGAPGKAFISEDAKTIVGQIMNVAYKIIDAGKRRTAAGDEAGLKAVLTNLVASVSAAL